jgi:ribosomal-protein-alanine acetyltransferase
VEGVTLRPLRPADAEAVERITAESPEATHWRPSSYQGLPGWVVEDETGVLGFLFARVAADEMEILNLAVTPAARKRGIGGALLAAAVDHGRRQHAARAFLEVRESNVRARRFYERRGFVVKGRRPRYYHHPEEDALVMARDLGDSR